MIKVSNKMLLHVHITGITRRPRKAKLQQCKDELVQELACEHFWQPIIVLVF